MATAHSPARRRSLLLIAATVAGATLRPQALLAQTASLIGNADICTLIPEVTEGPYYFDPELVRSDITESKPGLATTIRLQIVDALCNPLPDARVDIWHCDATGLYSNYAGQTGGVSTVGETFLRGTQFADANGIATFETIYPGWYPGRTTHIHFKVFLDETNVLTGQIFFPEEVTAEIYSRIAPYDERAATRTLFNDGDGIASQAGAASVAATDAASDHALVELVVGVDPAATSEGGGFGDGRGAPPPRNG